MPWQTEDFIPYCRRAQRDHGRVGELAGWPWAMCRAVEHRVGICLFRCCLMCIFLTGVFAPNPINYRALQCHTGFVSVSDMHTTTQMPVFLDMSGKETLQILRFRAPGAKKRGKNLVFWAQGGWKPKVFAMFLGCFVAGTCKNHATHHRSCT